jgi:two-component system, OmpR family, sensor histidine kinase CiaH
MKTTSKPFAVSGTVSSPDRFRRATLKLTLFYVLSTAVILLVSSVAVLVLFAPPETELPFFHDESTQDEAPEHDEWSLYELREHLVSVVVLVDITILAVVSVLSYTFARRTLLPIKQVYEQQQQFVADVAHELRTPLSVLQAGADTLLRKSRSEADYKTYLADVQTETGRLTRLTNQLLKLLSAEERAVVVEATDVSALIAAEVRRFVPYAAALQVSLLPEIASEIVMETEPDGVVEVVQNLLKNAIDYNRSTGQVRVLLARTSNEVTFSVIDTGVGMSKAVEQVVFNRFVKGSVARTQHAESGAGLGLSIVAALVARQGGKISLVSTEGVGTTVTVTWSLSHS